MSLYAKRMPQHSWGPRAELGVTSNLKGKGAIKDLEGASVYVSINVSNG
jgi:hypothetical protein